MAGFNFQWSESLAPVHQIAPKANHLKLAPAEFHYALRFSRFDTIVSP